MSSFSLKPHKSPHGKLLAISMMKDEAPFLLEWYAHHLAVGFTKILVYTNDCTDGTDQMLIRLEELGLGYHRENNIQEGRKPQPSAIKYAQEEPIVRQADWIMLFDADEFLSINQGDGTLDSLLDAAGDANGIIITWRIFGSSNVVDWSDEPVSEQYLYAAPPTWNKGWGVKTLFKFDDKYWRIGIHRPSIKAKHLKTNFPNTVKWLNGSCLPMEDYFKFRGWRSIRRTIGYQWAQLNHYAVKSIDSYALRKFRGNVNNKKDKYNADYWSLQDRNEVKDTNILRYSERRAQIVTELLKDPILHRLHFKALSNINARLEDYKKTPAYNELKKSLLKASKVPITQVNAKPPKARDPKKIAEMMSQAERKNAQRPTNERQKKPSAEFIDAAEGGNGFVIGEIDLSLDIPIEWIENHNILLPCDARVFVTDTLDALTKGKYLRALARRTPVLISPNDRVLDFGVGIGFLSMLTCLKYPQVHVLAQEDNSIRLQLMNDILVKNNFNFQDRLHIHHSPIFKAQDEKSHITALNALIESFHPTLVRISDIRLNYTTLSSLNLQKVKRLILTESCVEILSNKKNLEEFCKNTGFTWDQDMTFIGAFILNKT